MNWYLLLGMFLFGGWLGIPLGKWFGYRDAKPLMLKMSARIEALETELIHRVLDDDQDQQIEGIPEEAQVQILENMMRRKR